jgi:hypothetical protein
MTKSSGQTLVCHRVCEAGYGIYEWFVPGRCRIEDLCEWVMLGGLSAFLREL